MTQSTDHQQMLTQYNVTSDIEYKKIIVTT